MQNLPYGTVLYSNWLRESGYSFSLQQSYRQNGWLSSIGKGVMVRTGQKLMLSGAIYALQQMAELPVHIGGRTAIGLQGLAHYLEVNRRSTWLFVPGGTKLPFWLEKNQWDTHPKIVSTSFLPVEAGIISIETDGFELKIAGAARAMMECLEMAPNHFELNEAWEIMQGLNALNPFTVQQLLVQCKSVKVKRLFLFFAQKAGHIWFRKLEIDKINLGSGKRSMVNKGVYVPEYKITLPENLV